MGLRLGLPCCGCREKIWRVHISNATLTGNSGILQYDASFAGQEFSVVGTTGGFAQKIQTLRNQSNPTFFNVMEYPAFLELENVSGNNWRLTAMVNRYGRETVEFTNNFATEIADVEFSFGVDFKTRFVVTIMPFDQERPADFAWFPHRATFVDLKWAMQIPRINQDNPNEVFADKKTFDSAVVELAADGSDVDFFYWRATTDQGSSEREIEVKAPINKPAVVNNSWRDMQTEFSFFTPIVSSIPAMFLQSSANEIVYQNEEEIGLEIVDWVLQTIEDKTIRAKPFGSLSTTVASHQIELRTDDGDLFDTSLIDAYVTANPAMFFNPGANISGITIIDTGSNGLQRCSARIEYDKLILTWFQRVFLTFQTPTTPPETVTVFRDITGRATIDYPAFGSFEATVQNEFQFDVVPANVMSVDLAGSARLNFRSAIYANQDRKLASNVVSDIYLLPKWYTQFGKDVSDPFNWQFTINQPVFLATTFINYLAGVQESAVNPPTIHQGRLPTGLSFFTSVTGQVDQSENGKVGFVRFRFPIPGGREFITEPYIWSVGDPDEILIYYRSPYTNAPTQPPTGFDWRIDDAAPYEITATVINATNPIEVTLLSGTLPPSATIEATTGRIHSGGVPVITTPSTGSCTLRVTDDDARTNDTVTYNWQYVGEDNPVFVGDLYPSPYSNTATPPSSGFDWRFTDAVAAEILTLAEINGDPFDPAIYDFAIIAGSLPLDYFVDTDGTIRSGMTVETSDFTGSVQVRVTQTATGRIKTSRVYNWQFFGGAPPPPPPPP